MSRVKTSLGHKGIRRLIWLVLTTFVLLVYSLQSVAGSVYYSMVMQTHNTVTSPSVILQNGTAGNSTIYTNNTSALVTVEAPINDSTTFDYVLKVVNQVSDNWTINLQVYDSYNVIRLSNITISFHDGTSSDQIIVSGGNINQSEGPSYDLAGNATRYISMSNVQANASGTSYLYVNLKIQVPDSSTYSLYVITFKIT